VEKTKISVGCDDENDGMLELVGEKLIVGATLGSEVRSDSSIFPSTSGFKVGDKMKIGSSPSSPTGTKPMGSDPIESDEGGSVL